MLNWQNLRNLRRSTTEKWLGGVCGGLGSALGIPAWMLRAAFLFCLLAFGAGFLLYLVLWICIPR
jgi:phage shock protein PspC (stress-responsive transcriptional regulator)